MTYLKTFFTLILLCTVLSACDKNETDFSEATNITGTGDYIFSSYEPFSKKPIACYYHIPEMANSISPILIALHGAGRDADNMRDYLIEKADEKNFIVIAPEFSSIYFPGSDAYNIANIFEDGDDPNPETINPEEEWTFSVIDPLFEDFKNRIGNTVPGYDIFGHSAGSQLLHRYLIFKPDAKWNRVVCAAAGWYTMPDQTVDFPYGLGASPEESSDLSDVFFRDVTVIVGENDVDPNSFNLRHTPGADAQGNNRVQRAQYFFTESSDIAENSGLNYNWAYSIVPNAGHEGDANAVYAAELLYP